MNIILYHCIIYCKKTSKVAENFTCTNSFDEQILALQVSLCNGKWIVPEKYSGNKLGVSGGDGSVLVVISGTFNRDEASGTLHLSRPSEDQGVIIFDADATTLQDN